MSGAPAPVRVVTAGYDSKGTSVIQSDGSMPFNEPFGPQGPAFTPFYNTPKTPASNVGAAPSEFPSPPVCPPGGSSFCITDFRAGNAFPMHRTNTVDYAVVLSGEIELKVDSGEARTVKPGEFIVLRGAAHAWNNNTAANTRVLFAQVAAEPVSIGGKELPEGLTEQPAA